MILMKNIFNNFSGIKKYDPFILQLWYTDAFSGCKRMVLICQKMKAAFLENLYSSRG